MKSEVFRKGLIVFFVAVYFVCSWWLLGRLSGVILGFLPMPLQTIFSLVLVIVAFIACVGLAEWTVKKIKKNL